MSAPDALAGEKILDSSAYGLGFEVLGPILACFAHLLYRHARRAKSQCLAFLARDGDLLWRVATHLPCAPDEARRPKLLYVHLSRRATALPAQVSIGASELGHLLSRCAARETVGELIDSLGIPAPIAEAMLAKFGIDPFARAGQQKALPAIFGDHDIHLMIERERRTQFGRLKNYLLQHGIGRDSSIMLVDIGWRATIQRNLHRAFANDPDFLLPHGAYFGLWSEDGDTTEFPCNAIGLVCDLRRSRAWHEASAWYAAFLLEAVCRANEGSTLGYEPAGQMMTPVLAEDSQSRRAECASNPTASAVRHGILAYVERHGGGSDWLAADDRRLRARAQSHLLRLACFPEDDEIEIGGRLVHTEAHRPTWFAPLLAADRPHPLRSPAQWLAGLSSPWRMGYFHATGGPLLSRAMLLADSLLRMSPASYRAIARWARRASCNEP